jgi:hypothetical protein
MWWRAAVVSCVGVAVCLLAVGGSAGQDKKDKGKKFEVPKDAVAGVVKAVDMKKAAFTLTLPDKKERTFQVDAKTEFYGPKGGDRGTGPDGLKDDCMATGYEVRVVPAKDGKAAKDVYLPNRKQDPKGKDKKDK